MLCLAMLLLVRVGKQVFYFRRVSHMWGQGDRCRAGVSGHGQPVPHELLHLLLLWPGASGQSLLQRAWQSVL